MDKEEIYQLNRNLFKSTYRRLEACHEIDKILVVTKDEEILKLVDEWGGGVGLPENTSSSLNLAITQAFAYIQKSAESGPVLVIPADLPRMKRKIWTKCSHSRRKISFLSSFRTIIKQARTHCI